MGSPLGEKRRRQDKSYVSMRLHERLLRQVEAVQASEGSGGREKSIWYINQFKDEIEHGLSDDLVELTLFESVSKRGAGKRLILLWLDAETLDLIDRRSREMEARLKMRNIRSAMLRAILVKRFGKCSVTKSLDTV
jgi:hypothetical protein